MQISLSIRFSRARNPCSPSIHREYNNPPPCSSSYSISQGEVRLGACEMIDHSQPRQKWSCAENECLFPRLPGPSAEHIQDSLQMTRVSLLCSSLRFFTENFRLLHDVPLRTQITEKERWEVQSSDSSGGEAAAHLSLYPKLSSALV